MKVTSSSPRYCVKDVKVITGELKRIETANGLITPLAVLERARNENSALHRYFEWDDGVAAEKYRLKQAATLIRVICVQSEDGLASPVRAFVNVRSVDEDDEEQSDVQGYCSIERTQQNVPLKQQVLTYAKDQLKTWRRKFGAYSEFYAVSKEIDAL